MLPVGIAEVRLQGCISFTHALSGDSLNVELHLLRLTECVHVCVRELLVENCIGCT